jgi:hypothetical protein
MPNGSVTSNTTSYDALNVYADGAGLDNEDACELRTRADAHGCGVLLVGHWRCGCADGVRRGHGCARASSPHVRVHAHAFPIGGARDREPLNLLL